MVLSPCFKFKKIRTDTTNEANTAKEPITPGKFLGSFFPSRAIITKPTKGKRGIKLTNCVIFSYLFPADFANKRRFFISENHRHQWETFF